MQITRKHWVATGVGFIVAVLAVAWVYYAKTPEALPATGAPVTASSTASTTPVVQADAGTMQSFPINAADRITSWSFKGAYTGNDTLVAQANADVARLTDLLGEGKFDDYDLYIGIGNIHNLLGDGQSAYRSYNRAIANRPDKGLAFANLAHLMDVLGAYRTAADAYKKATAVEPGELEFHIQRLTYLTRQFGTDNALVLAAFTDASNVFGDTAAILSIEAEWLTGQKRYADAIKAWEAVKMLSPGKDVSAIDAEIARLKARQ